MKDSGREMKVWAIDMIGTERLSETDEYLDFGKLLSTRVFKDALYSFITHLLGDLCDKMIRDLWWF